MGAKTGGGESNKIGNKNCQYHISGLSCMVLRPGLG